MEGTPPQPPERGPQAPPGPEGPPIYQGPVPPGGWQQTIPRPHAWTGTPLASWGSRVAAAIIDFVVVGVPAVILFFVLVAGAVGITGNEDASAAAIIGAIVLWLLVVGAIGLLYAPTLMCRQGRRNGQTLGKQIVGIRVVRDSGEATGFWWAALREVAVKGLAVGVASSIIPLIPWLLDVLWPLWDDENRALHDMVVSTHVVRA
jgi:uncharacterized RDD family membrane protein YckC